MNLELLKKGPSQVFLIVEVLSKITLHIDFFEVLHQADLLAIVDSLVVFEELANDRLKHVLLCVFSWLHIEFSLLLISAIIVTII